jgi:hypothetical protein
VNPVAPSLIFRASAKVPGALSTPRPLVPEWPPIPKLVQRPPEKRHALRFHPGAPEEDWPDTEIPSVPAGSAEPEVVGPEVVGPEPDSASRNDLGEEPPLRRVAPAIRSEPVGRTPTTPRSGTAHPSGRGANPVRKKGLLWRLGGRAALPAAAAAVAAFVAATGYLAFVDRDAQPEPGLGRWAAAAPAAPVIASAAPAGDGSTEVSRPPGDPFGTAAVTVTGAPSRLRIKAIHLDTTLETLHLGSGGALVPPRGFGKAGWYADGTAPGDLGPAVIAGHVDSKSGPAVFYRLRELTTGDRIEVVRGGAVVPFTVVRTAWYPKNKFPTDAVYGPTPDRQLRLITCGGVFDHALRSYRDNLVVYAVAG